MAISFVVLVTLLSCGYETKNMSQGLKNYLSLLFVIFVLIASLPLPPAAP
jgi:hypothetical protein